MAFDMNGAWNEAVRLLRRNPELLALIAGLFVFLPTLTIYLIEPQTMAVPSDLDQANPIPQLTEYFQTVAGWMIALQLAQYAGLLAMVALFARRRPTVGDAIRNGLVALVPLILTQLLITFGVMITAALLLSLLSLGGAAGATIGMVLLFIAAFYLTARLFPVVAVIVFEKRFNPLKAIGESFRMTRGVGARLLAFLALLAIAWIVISLVLNLPVALIAALVANAEVALFVDAFFGALLSAIVTAVIAVLVVAVFRQLSAGREEAPSPDRRES